MIESFHLTNIHGLSRKGFNIMSHFQHSQAVNSASLSAIFDSRSDDWVTWAHPDKDGIAVDLIYGWGYWYIRSYISDTLGSQYTVIRTNARSLSTLRRKVKVLKEAYRIKHMDDIDEFLSDHFGAFHMYDTDLSDRWVKDVY